jgi:ketosteroid isomerase-like protein
VSEQNVELVMALQPAPDEDVAQRVRDDRVWGGLEAALGPLFHDDCECSVPRFGGTKTYVGVEGIRAAWLDWLAPWASYRSEIEKAIDLDDRVLLLVNDYGRRDRNAPEVRGNVAAIWTVRDGKIARADFYTDRSGALKAVGLEE